MQTMNAATLPLPLWVPAPITPGNSPVFTRGPAAPDVRVTVAVVPANLSPFEAGAVEVDAATPGAVLAPNFIFNTAQGVQCFTQGLGAEEASVACSGDAGIAACMEASSACLDAMARGLLGGLQPILGPSERVRMFTAK
jgi:hypothetical protein